MTIDEAIRILKLSIRDSREHIRFCYDEKGIIALEMAIKALEQQPCEDSISREDALMALTGEWTEITDEIIHRFIKRIKALPPVEPPTGQWVMRHRKVNTINYRTGEDVLTGEIHTVKELIRYETDEPYCACCGKRAEDISQDYCGYCGARMEVEQNG